MLSELSDHQETYKQLLFGLKAEGPDQDYRDAVTRASLQGVDDDNVIAVALAHLEMSNEMAAEYQEAAREPEENDLLYAQTLIDHLDTLGKVIVSK